MSRNHPHGSVLARAAAAVYIWHETQVYHGHGAVTRFYFVPKLDENVFKEKVLPQVSQLSGVMPADGVRHYQHHITVQWSTHLHDDPKHSLEETEASIERAVAEVLAGAFGWENPHVMHLTSLKHMREVAHRVGRSLHWRSDKL